MRFPKVASAVAIDTHTLLVEFDNAEKRLYDVAPLFDREPFSVLRKWAFFKNVRVEKSGYAVYWNSDVDLSEFELWSNGKVIDN